MNQSDYKPGMKVLLDHQGKTHKGTVEIEGKMIGICQDVRDGYKFKNRHGHKFSYALCDPDGTNFLGDDTDDITNIRPDPEADKKTPVKKYVFETVFKMNGEAFDIVAHREKIKRLSEYLKEAKAVERAFVNYQRGESK